MSATIGTLGNVGPIAGRAQLAGNARRARRIPRLRGSLAVAIPGGFLLIVALLTIFAPQIAPYDPNALDMKSTLQGPSAEHWLGTDQLGRDQL